MIFLSVCSVCQSCSCGGKFSSLLVDRNVIDLNLGIVVIGRVGDGVSAGTRETIAVEHSASPITTDGNIDDDAVVAEGVGDITTLARPVGNRNSPCFRVGVSCLDVLWDLVTLKSPKGDLSLVPKHSDDTTTSLIERTTSTTLEIVNGTTGVVAVGALAVKTEGASEETLWLRAVLILVNRWGVGV